MNINALVASLPQNLQTSLLAFGKRLVHFLSNKMLPLKFSIGFSSQKIFLRSGKKRGFIVINLEQFKKKATLNGGLKVSGSIYTIVEFLKIDIMKSN